MDYPPAFMTDSYRPLAAGGDRQKSARSGPSEGSTILGQFILLEVIEDYIEVAGPGPAFLPTL
jgi:hypothetical protein